ncbi:MAG TPA: hypothetical protein PLR06_08100 [Cyclobacteriaceae bacterium]|nr:hypothetical protein [Cyclobacteriaceae bacterium]
MTVFMMAFAPSWGQKDDGATTFPLDNFYAEIKHRPRSIFKNIKFGFSTGYGNTFFSHKLEGFGIYQAAGSPPSIFVASGPPTLRIANWVNQGGTDPTPFQGSAFTVNTNDPPLGFKGNALNIPLKLTLHYEFGGKYRIGGGYSYELMSIGTLKPISYTDQISGFQPTASSGWMSKYFGLIGVSFYRLGDYLFTGDAQIGGYNPGSNFNSALVKAGIYVNVGVTVERELSEYLSVFARPSFDIKSYSMTLPEGGPSIDHNINAFYINIGISYSIPELPKCFIHDCKIQMNHAHGNKEYRSRVHPIYKKQNPQYGENHPNLIKYKGKNKKKMNPY